MVWYLLEQWHKENLMHQYDTMTIKDQLFRRRKRIWISRHHPFKSFNSPLLVSFCLPLLINRCNSYCGWMVGLQSLCLNTCLFDKIISSRLQHLLPPCPLFAIDLCTSCLGSRLGCNHPVSRLSGVCIRHHCRLVWWLSWKYVYVLLTHKNTHFINIKLNCKMIRDRLCDIETGTFSLNKHLEPRERWFEQLIHPDIWLFFLVVYA